jgi:hypothetical protein
MFLASITVFDPEDRLVQLQATSVNDREGARGVKGVVNTYRRDLDRTRPSFAGERG